jgi:hypothetical protein
MVALRADQLPSRPDGAGLMHGTGPLIDAVEYLDHVALAVAPHPDGAFAKGGEQVERVSLQRPEGHVPARTIESALAASTSGRTASSAEKLPRTSARTATRMTVKLRQFGRR